MVVAVRTKSSSKLSTQARKELILNLCRGFASLSSSEQVADVLTDILTPKEIETIAKRLQIADYLVQGKDYDFIRDNLKVGYSTIARVNTWLNISGEGFKIILLKKKKERKPEDIAEKFDPYSWRNLKRRYSLYFWPQLILEEFIKNADNREKDKMRDILDKLEIKADQFKSESNKQLYEMFSSGVKKLGRK